MSYTLQDFLASATRKASADLAEAFLRLPEDRRSWSPGGKSRSAADLVAECTLLNGYTADLIQTRAWQTERFEKYAAEKAEAITQDWNILHARLQENTDRVIAAIAAVPGEALTETIEMPRETQTLAGISAYPYWNMTYHLGQINYIASILGCLN